MHNNILIEFVLTNQCNKRCKYCDLDFHGASQSAQNVEDLIHFLKKNSNKSNNFIINFFGGEPLLEFDSILDVLQKTSEISNISYTIGTNGILLDRKKYDILQSHRVGIYLSIDTETYEHIFKKEYLLQSTDLIINFILNPETIQKSFKIFERLISYGFKNFNIIPVYITIDWNIDGLRQLKKFVAFANAYTKSHNITFYSYYDPPTSDTQFILDTNGKFYRDIHTHLWFLKQFEVVESQIQDQIETFTYIGELGDKQSITDLCKKYRQDEIIKKSFLIPRYIGFEKTLRIIDKIITT